MAIYGIESAHLGYAFKRQGRKMIKFRTRKLMVPAIGFALIVSGLRFSNIALLLQKNYEAATSRFTIPMKTGENYLDCLMKFGREYRGHFLTQCDR